MEIVVYEHKDIWYKSIYHMNVVEKNLLNIIQNMTVGAMPDIIGECLGFKNTSLEVVMTDSFGNEVMFFGTLHAEINNTHYMVRGVKRKGTRQELEDFYKHLEQTLK